MAAVAAGVVLGGWGLTKITRIAREVRKQQELAETLGEQEAGRKSRW
jgi:hypothetical protein